MEAQLNRLLFLVFLVLLSAMAYGQIGFHKVYSGNGYDKGEGIAQLPDSGFLVTGSSSSFEDAPSQAFLLRLDSMGNYMWSRAYGGIEFEEGKRVMAVPGYGYYIAGTTSSSGSGDFDAWLFFTDENGNKQWETATDQGAWERIHDAILLPDTTIVAVGETDATPEGRTDLFMIRYSKTGSVIWKQQLHYSQGDDVAYAIEPVTDSTFIIAGTLYRSDSLQQKAYLGKFHRNGSLVWQQTYGTQGNYRINDLTMVPGGRIRAVGEAVKTGYTDLDVFSFYTEGTGAFLNAEEGHSDGETRFTCLVSYDAGNTGKFFVAHQVGGGPFNYPEGEDALISRYNSDLFWDGYGVSYSGVGHDQFNQLIKTSDGYAVAVGYHTTYGAGGNSAMVVKLGNPAVFPAGTTTPTVISIVDVGEQEILAGLGAYPNPFNETVTVTLPEQSFEWRLMDISGKLISVGTAHESQQLDCAELPGGVYLLKVVTSTGEATLRLVK